MLKGVVMQGIVWESLRLFSSPPVSLLRGSTTSEERKDQGMFQTACPVICQERWVTLGVRSHPTIPVFPVLPVARHLGPSTLVTFGT